MARTRKIRPRKVHFRKFLRTFTLCLHSIQCGTEELHWYEIHNYLALAKTNKHILGQKFAMLEMKATISKILRNFKILPTVPEHKVIISAETVLKSANGMLVRLEKRD